ncbi:malate dehydrogenase [Perkinsela sp. CCAP 1560/4]|nr:malate dehydrogenase [Perkinsela sp. CCAP 1560/4]|eukprot:KNH04115.1 malate dehydrogenase [Perkinsela sp. CCAP 1560/4]
MTGCSLPEVFSKLKNDLQNVPSHCVLEYIPRNNPFRDQNIVVLCPKDQEDIIQGARWYASHCTDEYNIPPLFVLCEDVNFATVLASHVVKRFISSNCMSAVPRSVIGVPTFSVYRARSLFAGKCRRNPYDIDLSLAIGGTPSTSVPLISVLGQHYAIPEVELQKVVRQIQQYPIETVVEDTSILHPEKTVYSELSQNSPSAMAFAGFEFIISFLRAQRGDGPATEVVFTEQFQNIEETVFDKIKNPPRYLARRAIIDQPGLVKLLGYNNLSPFEMNTVTECIPALEKDIQKAELAAENIALTE